jgi:hypothetical protein
MSLAGRLADTGDKTIMLYAIVLICGLSTPHLNCDETTAHRYERVPGGNELPFMCQRSAEIWAAEHVEIKAGEYPKIRMSLGLASDERHRACQLRRGSPVPRRGLFAANQEVFQNVSSKLTPGRISPVIESCLPC